VPVRGQLVFSEAVRLTGLLAHLLYWVIFKDLHPVEKHLPDESVQALQVTVHDLWTALIAPYRDYPMGVSFVIPALCLSIKRGIQWVFTSRYPKVVASENIGQQLSEQINVLFMQLFDPDCVYARFGVLDTTKQAVKLWRKYDMALASKGQSVSTRMITRKNRTTPAMQTLMGAECTGRPGNAKTRKLLAKSASDSLITAGPSRVVTSKVVTKVSTAGLSQAKKPQMDADGPTQAKKAQTDAGGPSQVKKPQIDELKKKPQMDELKQEALFKVACKQLSRSGLDALPTGPGKATASRALARAASAARLISTGPEGKGSGLNGRRRRSLRALAGRGMSPVKKKLPTFEELMQNYGKI